MTTRTLQPRTYVPPAGLATLRICQLLNLRGPMPTRDIHAAMSDTHTRNGVGQVVHHAVRSQLLTCNRSVFPHTFDVAAGWEAKAATMAPRAKPNGQPALMRTAGPSEAKPAQRPTPRMRPAPARRAQRAAPASLTVACVPPPLTTVQHACETQPTSVWALGVLRQSNGFTCDDAHALLQLLGAQPVTLLHESPACAHFARPMASAGGAAA